MIVERLPEDVARCVLEPSSYNSLREESVEDARAWNLARARAVDALDAIGLEPVSSTAASYGSLEECSGVWIAFGE